MKYVINYMERSLSAEVLEHIKAYKQKLVRVDIITAYDAPVGLSLTLVCKPTTEKGRGDLVSRLGANYCGNNVWETP